MHARRRRKSVLAVLFLVLACVASPAAAQSGFDDDRVMLQGFYWESHRHGHPGYEVFGQRGWYTIVRDNAETIADGRFDLIWLPPPSDAGEVSAGYAPQEYFNLGNSYGSFDDHRAMLEALLGKGIEPIADLVLNHRDGSGGWATFSNPAWGLWAITRNDEAFYNPASGVANTPLDQRGAEEEPRTPYGSAGSTTYAYDAYRDVDHTNGGVRRDLFRYLLQLKSLGYRGWRYDMVHGFHARWVADTPPHGADLLRRRVRLGQAGRAARLAVADGHDTRGSANLQFCLRLHDAVHAQGQQGPVSRLVRVRPRARSDG